MIAKNQLSLKNAFSAASPELALRNAKVRLSDLNGDRHSVILFANANRHVTTPPNSSTQQVTYSFTASGQAGTTTYPSGNQLTPGTTAQASSSKYIDRTDKLKNFFSA